MRIRENKCIRSFILQFAHGFEYNKISHRGNMLKYILSRALPPLILFCGILAGFSCGKSPTTPEVAAPPPTPQPSLTLSVNPSSGAADTIVKITISLKANTRETKVFGLDLTYDTKMFNLQGVSKGGLTSSWAAVAGNEIESGKVRIGGFGGSGTPIPVNSDGSLAKVQFKVTGGSLADGAQSQVCVKDYTDDIEGIKPDPACVKFTYKK
jgi:hypothetical protein